MRTISCPRSMFTCLYFESLVGLVLALLSFIFLSNHLAKENEIERFVQEGANQVNYYFAQADKPGSVMRHLQHVPEFESLGYKVTLVRNMQNGQLPCQSCILATKQDGISVYRTSSKLLAALYPIPSSQQWLLFEQTSSRENEADLSVHLSFPLFITMSIALGFLLYLPLYRVNKRINRLIATQERFGMGDLTARSEIYDISPVKELAKSFNEMAQDIEQRVKQNQIFYHAIPHEIRTPLSRIQMAIDILRRGNSEDTSDLFSQVDRSITDIADLTSDILKLAHLTDRKCDGDGCAKQKVDIVELCRQRVTRSVAKCGVMFDSEKALQRSSIEVTPALAKLVLDNLLKNADKYGRDTVKIMINYYECCWTIDIEDNGNGIPESKRQEIFIAFARLDQSRNANTGGFGLGLAIARSAAKQLGWKLAVDDSSLGGARFTVMIPNKSK